MFKFALGDSVYLRSTTAVSVPLRDLPLLHHPEGTSQCCSLLREWGDQAQPAQHSGHAGSSARPSHTVRQTQAGACGRKRVPWAPPRAARRRRGRAWRGRRRWRA